jgi:hypothetical protein
MSNTGIDVVVNLVDLGLGSNPGLGINLKMIWIFFGKLTLV